MGQKVHPIGIRLGISQDWNSTWYADTGDYANYLNDDIRIREFLKKQLSHASVSRIQIQRPAKSVIITIHSARPGIVIGKKGLVLKEVGTRVREQLPEGAFVELFVKVDKNWQRRPKALERLGY